MLDNDAAYLAFQTRLRALSVCTTGTLELAAIATGYTRDSGSFITDGFRPGMEIKPAGFATNAYATVKEVAALTLTTDQTLTVEASAGSRSIVAGLPETRLWENRKPVRSGVYIAAPTNDRPYVEDAWQPATNAVRTMPASAGLVEETGLYVVRLYGLENRGRSGISDVVDAIKALFTPGTPFTAITPAQLMVREDAAVQGGAILPLGNGWSACVITIPWRAFSRNAIAA